MISLSVARDKKPHQGTSPPKAEYHSGRPSLWGEASSPHQARRKEDRAVGRRTGYDDKVHAAYSLFEDVAFSSMRVYICHERCSNSFFVNTDNAPFKNFAKLPYIRVVIMSVNSNYFS